MALRATDRYVWDETKQKPISVAFDKLGAVTASWALVEAHMKKAPQRTGRQTADGMGRLIETCPAAQIGVWADRYKQPADVRDALTAAPEAHGLRLRLDEVGV